MNKAIIGLLIAIAIVIGMSIHDINTLVHGENIDLSTIVCETGGEWTKDLNITSIKHREHKNWRRSSLKSNSTAFFWCDLSTYHK